MSGPHNKNEPLSTIVCVKLKETLLAWFLRFLTFMSILAILLMTGNISSYVYVVCSSSCGVHTSRDSSKPSALNNYVDKHAQTNLYGELYLQLMVRKIYGKTKFFYPFIKMSYEIMPISCIKFFVSRMLPI